MAQEEVDDLDVVERAAWAIVFSEHAGAGRFDFETGEWKQPTPEGFL